MSSVPCAFLSFGRNLKYGLACYTRTFPKCLIRRLVKFSDFHAHSSPIFKELKILKVQDYIKLQNCLFRFVHDFLNKNLPCCFQNYFETISDVRTQYTVSSALGCLFIPHFNTTKHGIKLFTRKCIDNWNFFTTSFNRKLIDLSRSDLKKKISDHFINSY